MPNFLLYKKIKNIHGYYICFLISNIRLLKKYLLDTFKIFKSFFYVDKSLNLKYYFL